MTAEFSSDDGSIIGRLSQYMTDVHKDKLPEEVALKGKHHILDTIAAMVSGTTLEPGQLAIKYAEAQGGTHEAQVVGAPIVTNAVNAALANGILAHADETDDSHAASGTHPGCAIVPAAMAMADKNDRNGETLLNAVVLGYDIGCRVMRALRPRGNPMQAGAGRMFSSHAVGGVFGAAAAAGASVDMEPTQVRHLLSYAAQQAQITIW